MNLFWLVSGPHREVQITRVISWASLKATFILVYASLLLGPYSQTPTAYMAPVKDQVFPCCHSESLASLSPGSCCREQCLSLGPFCPIHMAERVGEDLDIKVFTAGCKFWHLLSPSDFFNQEEGQRLLFKLYVLFLVSCHHFNIENSFHLY